MTVIAIKKAPSFLGAFFVLSLAVQASEPCEATGELEKARIKRVVDGDTIHLSEWSKSSISWHWTRQSSTIKRVSMRLMPWTRQTFLRSRLDRFVYIQKAKDERDRYGRYLYYLFDKDRISLTSQLLSEGLGYRIAVPPNLAYQACFEAAENSARNAHKGIMAANFAMAAKSWICIFSCHHHFNYSEPRRLVARNQSWSSDQFATQRNRLLACPKSVLSWR